MKIPDKYRKIAGSLGLMACGAALILLFYWGRDLYYDHKFLHAVRTNDTRTLESMGMRRSPVRPPVKPPESPEAGK